MNTVLITFGHSANGYYNVHSVHQLGGDCLRSATCMALALPNGASLTVTVDDIRWNVELTPAVREMCRKWLIAHQAEILSGASEAA